MASTTSTSDKSLVLVLGAGASKEVNLPVGADLKDRIARCLDIRFENGYQQDSGDDKIAQALKLLPFGADGRQGDINASLPSCWRIRDAMPQAISIDNFIDSHRGEDRIALCGKLAIARCILQAEEGSSLVVDRSNINNKLDFRGVADTWFNAFFQLLTENCQAEDIPIRMAKVAIVSFNYDRCLEHYLHQGMQNYYGMSSDEAGRIVAKLEVHHPYGRVGSLPWMSQPGAIEYGTIPNPRQLIEIAKQLRTFTEGTDPSTSDIDSIRATMASADRLLFLGFAFHPLNLDLLYPAPASESKPAKSPRVFATAYGLSKTDARLIGADLCKKTGQTEHGIEIRTDLTCTHLFREHGRSLSLI